MPVLRKPGKAIKLLAEFIFENFLENFFLPKALSVQIMRFLPWWRGQRSPDPAGNRLARFRKVLEAAQAFPHYEMWLRSCQLNTKKAVRSVKDIESVLVQFGVFTLDQVRVRPQRPIGSPVVFASPLSLGVTPDLYWKSEVRAKLDTSTSKRGHRALFIRIGFDEGLLSPIERDGLWQRHGVPMFEHLVGMDGELLAWECETHSGLHVSDDNAVFENVGDELLLTSLTDLVQPTLQMRTGWSARIETEPCDCGRPGPRLIRLRERILYSRTAQRPDVLAAAAHG